MVGVGVGVGICCRGGHNAFDTATGTAAVEGVGSGSAGGAGGRCMRRQWFGTAFGTNVFPFRINLYNGLYQRRRRTARQIRHGGGHLGFGQHDAQTTVVGHELQP